MGPITGFCCYPEVLYVYVENHKGDKITELKEFGRESWMISTTSDITSDFSGDNTNVLFNQSTTSGQDEIQASVVM